MSNCTICIILVFHMSRGTICIYKTFTCRVFHRRYTAELLPIQCKILFKKYYYLSRVSNFFICKMTITCHVALSVDKIVTYVKLSYLYIYKTSIICVCSVMLSVFMTKCITFTFLYLYITLSHITCYYLYKRPSCHVALSVYKIISPVTCYYISHVRCYYIRI